MTNCRGQRPCTVPHQQYLASGTPISTRTALSVVLIRKSCDRDVRVEPRYSRGAAGDQRRPLGGGWRVLFFPAFRPTSMPRIRVHASIPCWSVRFVSSGRSSSFKPRGTAEHAARCSLSSPHVVIEHIFVQQAPQFPCALCRGPGHAGGRPSSVIFFLLQIKRVCFECPMLAWTRVLAESTGSRPLRFSDSRSRVMHVGGCDVALIQQGCWLIDAHGTVTCCALSPVS